MASNGVVNGVRPGAGGVSQRHLRVLQEVAVGRRLARLPLERRLLRAARRGLPQCEVAIWRLEPTGDLASLQALLSRTGQDIRPGSFRFEVLRRVPITGRWARTLPAGRVIAADDALHDPRFAQFRETHLVPLRLGAILTVALRSGSEIHGVMGAHVLDRPHAWTAEEQGFLASLADLGALAISEARLREANAELMRERDRAEAANAAKDAFLGSLSHELRTPLSQVIGFGELLRDDAALPRCARGHAAEIVGAGQGLLSVIDRLLDYGRLAARERRAEPRALHAAPFLQGVACDWRARDAARPLEACAADELRLNADPTLLRPALDQLLDNAFRYSPPGAPIGLAAEIAAEGWVELTVADQGPGPPGEAGRTEAWRRSRGGIGLGLPLARAYAELQGGTLSLRPRPGGGTVAAILLPTP